MDIIIAKVCLLCPGFGKLSKQDYHTNGIAMFESNSIGYIMIIVVVAGLLMLSFFNKKSAKKNQVADKDVLFLKIISVLRGKKLKYGFDALTVPEQYFLCVVAYDAYMQDRLHFHYHYFSNRSSNHWKLTLQGLKAIGARKKASILQDVVTLFGPEGPPNNPEARKAKMDAFNSRQDNKLEAYDEQSYKYEEENDSILLLVEYAYEHRFNMLA